MWQQHAPCGLLEHTAAIFILATIYSSSGAVLYCVNTYFEVMVVNVVVIVVLVVREVESRVS